MSNPNRPLKNFFFIRGLQIFAPSPLVSRQERVIVFLIFAIFAVAFCTFQTTTAWFHHLDTAFLMETLTSIKETGVPTTYLGPSFIDAANTFFSNAEVLCRAELVASGRGLSVLDSHAYLVLYPLAAFTWLFPPHIILSVVNGLSFVLVVFILYWVIRRQSVPALGPVAFCLLVMAHPAWSHASLGDFYADRFFMPLGLLYISLLYDAMTRQSNISPKYLSLILVVGLLASSTTERAAIMIALVTIACLVLYRNNVASRNTKIILVIFSVTLLAYVFLYLKLLYVHYDGTGNSLGSLLQGLPLFFEQIQAPAYAAKTWEFIVINVLLFGIFALFDWRLALIAFAAMLPNILTTIGGAEKTGWGTHYHSMYFPFLAFASAMGYSRLWNLLGAVKYRVAQVGLALALIPLISNYSPGYGDQNGAVKRVYAFYAKGEKSYEKYMAGQMEQIAAAIPAGSKVTTSEGFVPILYHNRTIYYYPVGLDKADYAVLTRVGQPDGFFYYAGAVSYIGQSQKADICLTQRLRKVGFNVEQPRLLVGDMVVLERKK